MPRNHSSSGSGLWITRVRKNSFELYFFVCLGCEEVLWLLCLDTTHIARFYYGIPGSMQTTDGNKLVATGKHANQMKMVQCSRWEEIQESVSYHIQLAAAMKAPTTFRVWYFTFHNVSLSGFEYKWLVSHFVYFLVRSLIGVSLGCLVYIHFYSTIRYEFSTMNFIMRH